MGEVSGGIVAFLELVLDRTFKKCGILVAALIFDCFVKFHN